MEEGLSIPGKERERFRSMGEAQVGRLLNKVGVTYLYEHPVAVMDDGKVRIWYPDFQLPGYGILVEYCGVKDNAGYDAGMRKKQAVYESNGLTAVMLTPDDLRGNWPGKVLGRIEGILQERVGKFREKRESAYGKRRSLYTTGSR